MPHRAAAASVIGRSHKQTNTPCQDAHAVHILQSGRFVIAVADGLGSARFSHIGSQLAVDSATDAATMELEKYKLSDALESSTDPDFFSWRHDSIEAASRTAIANGFQSAREKILSRAKEDGIDPRQLATTLILAAGRLGTAVVLGHLGDGGVVSLSDKLTLSSTGTETEYANETTPITGARWREQIVWSTIPKPRALALFTDGIQRRVLEPSPDGLRPVARFFDPIFDAVKTLDSTGGADAEFEKLLHSDKMDDPTGDDKTLVVITQ